MVSVLDHLRLPAVFAPSEETAISLEEEQEEVKHEANEFNVESHEVAPYGDWKESDIEEPDKDPGTWQTPGKENSIPEPVNQEVNKLVS